MAGTHQPPVPDSAGPGDSIAARARRLLARAQWRSTLRLLAFVVVLLVGLVLVGDELERHLAAFEMWVADLGPWAMPAFVGLFVVAASMLVPDTVLCVTAGALFGLWQGAAVAIVGTLLAGSFQYGLARHLLRERIQKALTARPALAAIQRAVLRDELRLQLLVRLSALNPATTSYLLGAAGVRFPPFLLAGLGLIPHLFLEVYFGHAGRHVARVAGSGLGMTAVRDLPIVGGLVVTVVVMILVSRAAKTAVTRALADAEPVA